MDDDLVSEGEALDALQAWLLAEEAYARGGVPDEVLVFLQDHIGRLLGPHATQVAGDYWRRHNSVARDRAALVELLVLIEGKRRRGFELEWRANLPVSEGGSPQALLVMAEYGVEDPVWDRPSGDGGPVSLAELGVSASLVQRLRAWNDTFQRPGSPGAGWASEGLVLARELQQELPRVDVRYFHGDDDRPLRGR